MGSIKHHARKNRLIKRNRQTRWAPFWTVLKKFGKGRQVHPARLTHVKRNWRRNKMKV